MPTWRGSFALLCLLGSASSALAQRSDDFLQTFGTITQFTSEQATQAAWAKLPSTEVGCIDNALHQQGGSVEALIQRGVLPSDPRLANERSNCQDQFERQHTPSSSSVYAVSGVTLGAKVRFGSSGYREYKCGPSDQFDGFTWCQKIRKEKERRGTFNATYSILHSRDGVAVYVNRYQEPAFFGASEADDDIQYYSRKIGESPRITRMPQRAGIPTGMLATWGKVELEPLDDESMKALAEDRRPTRKGYIVDFIGNFARSAKEGLPIYRISGGAGFVWIASFNQKGRGTLRLTAVDASALVPPSDAKPPIETVEQAAGEKVRGEGARDSADDVKTDADVAREDADKARNEAASVSGDKVRISDEANAEKAGDEAARAKADTERAVATESNAVVPTAERGAAEAKSHAMGSVAYGAIIGLIVLAMIVASALVMRKRKTTTAADDQSEKLETGNLEVAAEPASAAATELSKSEEARSTTLSSSQVPELLASPRRLAATLVVGIRTAGTLSAGAIGAFIYSLAMIIGSALAMRRRKTTRGADDRSEKLETRNLEPTEVVAEGASTADAQPSKPEEARSISSRQVAELQAFPRRLAAAVVVGIATAGTLSARAIGAFIYSLAMIVASALAMRERKTTTAADDQSEKLATGNLEPTEVVAEGASTADAQPSKSEEARSISSSQVAELPASPRRLAAAVVVGIATAGTLSAGAIGGFIYSEILNPKQHADAPQIHSSTNVPWRFRVKKGDMTDHMGAFVIGWQENEHGAVAEVIGECLNRRISFKAAVAGRDAEQKVELPWEDKLEDYRIEIGKFMQVIYLPIAVKINDDEPQIIKRLHEERFGNVIRLVTLLSDRSPASDHEPSTRKNREYVSVELDDLLSTAEKAALTLYYPDKSLRISEVRKITVQFETSKAAMPIKIMMDDPAIQKLVDFCENQ